MGSFRSALPTDVGSGLQRAVFACAEVLPVVFEGLALTPFEIHRPEVDKVERRLDRARAQCLQFLIQALRQGQA